MKNRAVAAKVVQSKGMPIPAPIPAAAPVDIPWLDPPVFASEAKGDRVVVTVAVFGEEVTVAVGASKPKLFSSTVLIWILAAVRVKGSEQSP